MEKKLQDYNVSIVLSADIQVCDCTSYEDAVNWIRHNVIDKMNIKDYFTITTEEC
jgi:hypothetical protein